MGSLPTFESFTLIISEKAKNYSDSAKSTQVFSDDQGYSLCLDELKADNPGLGLSMCCIPKASGSKPTGLQNNDKLFCCQATACLLSNTIFYLHFCIVISYC